MPRSPEDFRGLGRRVGDFRKRKVLRILMSSVWTSGLIPLSPQQMFRDLHCGQGDRRPNPEGQRTYCKLGAQCVSASGSLCTGTLGAGAELQPSPGHGRFLGREGSEATCRKGASVDSRFKLKKQPAADETGWGEAEHKAERTESVNRKQGMGGDIQRMPREGDRAC